MYGETKFKSLNYQGMKRPVDRMRNPRKEGPAVRFEARWLSAGVVTRNSHQTEGTQITSWRRKEHPPALEQTCHHFISGLDINADNSSLQGPSQTGAKARKLGQIRLVGQMGQRGVCH